MRARLMCFGVVLAVLVFCGRCQGALSPEEKAAAGTVKAAIKSALAGFKTSNAADLAVLLAGLEAVVADVEGGSLTGVENILTALESATVDGMLAIYENGIDAFESAGLDSSFAYSANSVEAPPGFRPGDGGNWDKMRAAVEKELLKIRKKIEGGLRKASKAIAKSSGANIAVNFVVRPIRFGMATVFTDDTGIMNSNHEPGLCVVFGGSDARISNSAVVIAGGIAQEGVFVTMAGLVDSAAAATFPGVWIKVARNLAPRNYLVTVKASASINYDLDREAIGTKP